VNAFREVAQTEANRLAHEILEALHRWSEDAAGHVEEVVCPDRGGFWMRVRVGPFALVACGRRPGQPYQPLTFPDADAALSAAARVRDVLRPPAEVEQEVYLNTLHFQHGAGERPA
jgi:hypothetical protein